MEKTLDCVVLGYAGVDKIIRARALPKAGVTAIVTNDDHARLYFGGNGTNIAYGLGRLGVSAHPLMRVGGDYKELGYMEFLRGAGVETGGICVVESDVTSVCTLVEDDDKNHLTMTYPGAMNVKYAVEQFDDEVFLRARYAVLSVSTYADVVQFLQKVRKFGLPLVFAMRADYESFPKPILRDILLEAELIFMNKVECLLIEEMFGLTTITELFTRGKARIIVTTLGADGSLVYENKAEGAAETYVSITPGGKAADATGAGDSYIAGFLYGLCRGKTPAECAEYGSTVASFIIEKQGCLTGSPDEKQVTERHKTRERST